MIFIHAINFLKLDVLWKKVEIKYFKLIDNILKNSWHGLKYGPKYEKISIN
jgi:hypothetical protein